jgi:hypothetical protein
MKAARPPTANTRDEPADGDPSQPHKATGPGVRLRISDRMFAMVTQAQRVPRPTMRIGFGKRLYKVTVVS